METMVNCSNGEYIGLIPCTMIQCTNVLCIVHCVYNIYICMHNHTVCTLCIYELYTMGAMHNMFVCALVQWVQCTNKPIVELSTSPAFKQYIWLLKISRFEVGMVSGGSLQQKLSYANTRYTQCTHIHTHAHTCTQIRCIICMCIYTHYLCAISHT